ncbi:MAG TPA: DUF4235 domain-containing protein [Longimicrobiales bacterium]|nr:DUF4235 domain-containing protein [Longimicrobiales bacterium]
MSRSTADTPLLWSAVAGLAALGAAVAARAILTRSWEKTFDEPAPRNPAHSDVPVARALAWAIASAGVAAGARLAARALTTRLMEQADG